jgi:hypothetical protein
MAGLCFLRCSDPSTSFPRSRLPRPWQTFCSPGIGERLWARRPHLLSTIGLVTSLRRPDLRDLIDQAVSTSPFENCGGNTCINMGKTEPVHLRTILAPEICPRRL